MMEEYRSGDITNLSRIARKTLGNGVRENILPHNYGAFPIKICS